MDSASSPEASTRARVAVPAAITAATRGGSKSTGITHAAGMTFVRPPAADVTRTTGP